MKRILLAAALLVTASSAFAECRQNYVLTEIQLSTGIYFRTKKLRLQMVLNIGLA